MTRTAALGNLVQAALFGVGAWWLGQRWSWPMAIAITCAGLQLGAAVAILRGKPGLARWASLITLVGVGVIAGLYYEAAQHLQEAYGGDARKIGKRSLWIGLGALPWFVFFPLCQTVAGGKLRALFLPGAVLLLTGLLPWSSSQAVATWPTQPAQEAAAMAAFQLWTGSDLGAPLPQGTGPAAVLLTPWNDGKPGKSARGDGEDLAQAISAALDRLEPPGEVRAALVLDVARSLWPRGAVVRAGESGGLEPNGGTSPTVIWQRKKVKARAQLPMWRLPLPNFGKGRTRKQRPAVFESWVASDAGAFPLQGAWAAPPLLTAQTALAAALAGGRMLAHHQTQTGKFAYTVQGPSGKVRTKSYNYPRHAGTTWFLARLAARTGDPEITAAADAGLRFMAAHTQQTASGGAYLHDPRRKDGKTWAGTTALAALAAQVRGHPLAGPWGHFLAESVDDQGQVRGEMHIESETFPPQQKNPYGQGQVVLALAALVRGGQDELRPALERGAAYLDGDYAPGGVGRILTLDEHWTCLAALAARDALGTAHGEEVCRAYLAAEAHQAPGPTQRLRPHSGSAGGLAEAVVAGAILDPDGPWRAQALAHGQRFLANAYQTEDAAFLPNPAALIGGFRDTPTRLHVRMDAVQHVGCALLGIEALLSQPQAGSLP